MLPELRELATATVEFFALRVPTNTPTQHPQDLEERTLTPVHDPVSRLTRECASLRQRLEEADRRQSECTCHTSSPSTSSLQQSSMRKSFDETRRELAKTQSELLKLQDRCRLLEKTLFETREILKARDEELEKLKGLSAESGVVEEAQDRSSGSFDQRGEDDSRPGSILDESRALLKTTEVFMTRTDAWSGAQVLQAIHDLNSEILQFSAATTELCAFGKNTTSSKLVVQATQDTASRLGPSVVRILSGRDHSQDPILVQLALQGCISTCVARALSVFCMGFPTKADAVLTQIYSHMYAAEPQPTSSRWRALTHRHIHTMYPYLSDYSANELAETMYRWSADILIVAGCQSYGKGSLASRDGLRTRFGEQVRRITKTACKLAQVTKEEIMSTCFEITAIEHGDTFDSRRMFDSFGEYGTSRGSIVTTAELGLQCKTRKSGGEEDSLTEVRMLMPPKVVLDSVLELVDPR